MFFVLTIITLYICFIHTKAIIVKLSIFFVNIEIANCCLNIIECVSIVRRIFVLFLEIKSEANFFYHFDYRSLFSLQSSKLIRFVSATKFNFSIKLWSFFNYRLLIKFVLKNYASHKINLNVAELLLKFRGNSFRKMWALWWIYLRTDQLFVWIFW